MDMPLVAYGHAGYPLLMFPTAAADYLEYERFHLVDAIKDLIEAGKIRAYSINSVNKYSLLNRESHPGWKGRNAGTLRQVHHGRSAPADT
jgi:esterase/lipase superfamily enzyme